MNRADQPFVVPIFQPAPSTEVSPESVIEPRSPLPYPNGWFAACFSHELGPGQVRIEPFMGHELVIYRTRSGQAHAVEPYCPHLGAHLGHGGRVSGDDLVCPFHGLAFGPDGSCVRSGDGRKPPAAALKTWRVHERNGMVLVWRDRAGHAPDWEIPELDTTGFSRLKSSVYELNGYVQDAAENCADLTHQAWLHGLSNVGMTFETDQHRMAYHVNGRWHGIEMHMQIETHGLGYQQVRSTLPGYGLKIITRGFATPTAPMKWIFRWSDNIRVGAFDALPGALRNLAYALPLKVAHAWFLRLSYADVPIWNNRSYLARPKLIDGESSIAAFRRWVVQFYPDDTRR